MGIAELLEDKRPEILAIAARYGASNLRVFGSVARGEAGPASDVDLLVTLDESSPVSTAELLEMAGKDSNFARGEITLVLEGAPAVQTAPDDAFVRRALALLRGELPPSRAAAVVAQLTGRRKSEVYAMSRGGEPEAMPEAPSAQD